MRKLPVNDDSLVFLDDVNVFVLLFHEVMFAGEFFFSHIKVFRLIPGFFNFLLVKRLVRFEPLLRPEEFELSQDAVLVQKNQNKEENGQCQVVPVLKRCRQLSPNRLPWIG